MSDGRNWLVSGLLAAVLVTLALVVKGGHPGATVPPPLPVSAKHDIGAIVIEKERTLSQGSGAAQGAALVETMLTETSASGRLIATYSTAGAPGAAQTQVVNVGNGEQIYDPRDNTIYVTTFQAIVAAQQRLIEQSEPNGTQGERTFKVTFGTTSTPGWTSEYEQDVRDHSYRVGSETTVDGRAAVELVPTTASRRVGSGFEDFPTVYVSPTTYDPIQTVTRFSSPFGSVHKTLVSITDWLQYKVIPATPANRRLLSLSAMHPKARISHSAMAYVRATSIPDLFGGTAHPGAASGSS